MPAWGKEQVLRETGAAHHTARPSWALCLEGSKPAAGTWRAWDPLPIPGVPGGTLCSCTLSQRSQAGDPEVGGSRVHLEPGLAIPRWDTPTMLPVGRLPRLPDRVTSPCWRYLATLAL